MPNSRNVEYATQLLAARPELGFDKPISTFIGDDPTPERLTEAALAVAQPEILWPYIDAVVADPSGTSLETIPPFMLVSNDHDGCGHTESLHAVTIAKGDNWDSRIHVWHEGPRLTEDLHTHRADFGSVTLVGTFADEVFVEAGQDDGKLMTKWRYDRLDPVGLVAMRSLCHRRFRPGDSYPMPHSTVHSAQVNPIGLSATVVVRRFRDHTSTGYTDGPRTTTFPRPVSIDGVATLRCLRAALRNT